MEHHRAEEFDDIKHAMQLDFRRALIDDLRNHVGELTQDREKKTKNQLTLFLRTVIIHGRLIIQCLILSPEIRAARCIQSLGSRFAWAKALVSIANSPRSVS